MRARFADAATGNRLPMGQRWTFEGDVEPGQVVVAYTSAGEELGRWPVGEAGDASIEADEEPEWRIEPGQETIPGSPA